MRLLAAMLMALTVLAGGAHARSVPPLTGSVVEEHTIFTTQGRSMLEAKLREIERIGAQGAILVIQKLDGETLFTFTQKTFDTWKLGQRKLDNGFILAYARAENGMRFHTGYGLEGVIPDTYALHIVQTILDTYAKQAKGKKDSSLAFMAGLDVVEKLLKKEPVEIRARPPHADIKYAWFLLVFIVGAIFGEFHPLAGGLAGAALSGVIAAIALASPVEVVLTWMLVGFIIGLIANFIIHNFFFNFGGGGSGGISGSGGMSGGGGAEVIGAIIEGIAGAAAG